MAYRLALKDRSVECAMQRIAREQIAAAVQAIDDPALNPDTAVHDVRKCCKKVRGLLRLVRPVFPDHAVENRAFRDIAAFVSGLRDADILIATYDALVTRHGDQIERRALAPIRRRLTIERNADAAAQDPMELLARCRSSLVAAAGRTDQWHLQAEDFAAIKGGLRTTVSRARKAMRAAQDSPSTERFHQWRKRCKDHWYHTRLLRPIWPGPMRAHAQCAEALGEALGEHHDLAVFQQAVAGHADAFGKSHAVDVMASLAHARQGVLEAEAFALGTRLLAQSPSALTRSWGIRFDAWRAEDG